MCYVNKKEDLAGFKCYDLDMSEFVEIELTKITLGKLDRILKSNLFVKEDEGLGTMIEYMLIDQIPEYIKEIEEKEREN